MPLVSTEEPVYRAQILKAAGSVGVLGGSALSGPRIMAALCDPEIQAREVCSLIAREPALCARVLRVANSAFYGHARSIATLERALALLGQDAVRGIAAAASPSNWANTGCSLGRGVQCSSLTLSMVSQGFIRARPALPSIIHAGRARWAGAARSCTSR